MLPSPPGVCCQVFHHKHALPRRLQRPLAQRLRAPVGGTRAGARRLGEREAGWLAAQQAGACLAWRLHSLRLCCLTALSLQLPRWPAPRPAPAQRPNPASAAHW